MSHVASDNARMATEHEARQYPLYLYEFRYRCERTGKWRKARYRAELHEIRERYAEFEIMDEPMVITGPAEPFNPYRRRRRVGVTDATLASQRPQLSLSMLEIDRRCLLRPGTDVPATVFDQFEELTHTSSYAICIVRALDITPSGSAMPSASSIQQFRQFYANLITRTAGVTDDRLCAAFADVQRESFVGAGPWAVFVSSGYVLTPSDDPRFLYQDIVVALDRENGINNGQPSLHARCLAASAPKPGESFLHIGTGTGYYTAIAASLVGDAGRVIAYEINASLAAKASSNLGHLRQVTVHARSGCDEALPEVDVIYVSAGATHPLKSWLDALRIGGRLVFPLTPNEGFGVMLCVKRIGMDSYSASVLIPVAFIPCIGARDDAASEAIAMSLRTRAIMATKSLRRDTNPDSTATCVGAGWWLSGDPPS